MHDPLPLRRVQIHPILLSSPRVGYDRLVTFSALSSDIPSLIIDALSCPPDTNLSKFGTQALSRFEFRLGGLTATPAIRPWESWQAHHLPFLL